MTKIIHKWFQCELCPVESDTYYLLTRDGKEIKVCGDCKKRIIGGDNEDNQKRRLDRNTLE